MSWENCELVLAKIQLVLGCVLLYNTQTSYKTCASPHLHVLPHMSSLLILISVSRLLFNMYGVRLSCGASGNSVTSVHTRLCKNAETIHIICFHSRTTIVETVLPHPQRHSQITMQLAQAEQRVSPNPKCIQRPMPRITDPPRQQQ